MHVHSMVSLSSATSSCLLSDCIYSKVNLIILFGPISPTYMAEPFGQMAIVCGFSKLPQWSTICSVFGSMVNPRIGICGDVGPFTAYTKFSVIWNCGNR